VVILGLYSAYAETTSWQGTYGKKILKIKVGDVIGQPLDGGTAFKRNVMKIIVLSTLPLLMIWVLFDKKNRGPYDVIAKTLVVSAKDYSDR
ncbi:MAG: RDD family protein, partial [Flavobacteriales bacterium]|nr:RDD family protein [Flavobacteriales bacterium]